MSPSPDKNKQKNEKLNTVDKSVIIEEQKTKVTAADYPLFLLQLEGEEDSFVKGYN